MKPYYILPIALFTLMALGLSPHATFAQTVQSSSSATATAPTSSVACLVLPYNLHYGAYDGTSQGEVTTLQQFLATQGYFDSANIGTGHFGPLTLKSVIRFQAAQNLPMTGFVGPLTRAAIAQSQTGCTTIPPPVTTFPPVLYMLSPTSAPVGATMNITGFGFTNANTILFNGSVAARNVPITSSIAIACTTSPLCHGGINQTLTITIPSSLSPNCPIGSMCPMYMQLVTPGQYNVTVQNTNGTSNVIAVTVTSANPQPSSLSISGLDTPASLRVNQTGTWTVHVLPGSGSGNLHYSVVWGDEGRFASSAMSPQAATTQTSATFSHTYQNAGTYSPVFTVTDDSGATLSTSNTLTVSQF